MPRMSVFGTATPKGENSLENSLLASRPRVSDSKAVKVEDLTNALKNIPKKF